MHDDIPEAIRHSVNDSVKPNLSMLAIALGGTLLAAILLSILFWPRSPSPVQPTAQSPAQSPIVAPAPTTSASGQASSSSTGSSDQLLGHLSYSEAPQGELEPITSDGQIQLRHSAAEAYRKMLAAAEADGVNLVPISGFRSVADQEELFFRVKESRNQDVSKRAEVSAPPGHSEHHTGYALDVGDASRPDANLSQSFAETPALQWLSDHAAQHSFELSFKEGNAQGVSYEPWHWRFVGDRDSLETFYRAQQLNRPSAP